jgi:prolyl 4-hydroxylase
VSLWAEAAALGRAGRPRDAVALIERAAEAGDAEGNLILAHWLLYGSDRPRDAAAAQRHLKTAAQAGNAEAARMRAHLTANGIGCSPDRAKAIAMLQEIADRDPAAAEQLELLPRMMTDDQAKAAKRERLSSDPSIEIVRSILLPDECAHVMRLAEPALKPSRIDDPVTGRGRPDPIRTSHGAAFLPHAEDLVLQAINRRIALASDTEIGNAESMFVMRYTPGQEYKPHLDALANLRNQRAWTAIAYLNDQYKGGATVFPELGITVRGKAGDLLVFRNVDEAGNADPRLRHGGEPVTSGAKWIATRWIRSGPHDPYDRG